MLFTISKKSQKGTRSDAKALKSQLQIDRRTLQRDIGIISQSRGNEKLELQLPAPPSTAKRIQTTLYNSMTNQLWHHLGYRGWFGLSGWRSPKQKIEPFCVGVVRTACGKRIKNNLCLIFVIHEDAIPPGLCAEKHYRAEQIYSPISARRVRHLQIRKWNFCARCNNTKASVAGSVHSTLRYIHILPRTCA